MSESTKKSGISRREFIGSAATAAAGLTLLPSRVVGGTRQLAPSDKLNIAGVGVGGMGRANLKYLASENIVALCDVDWRYSKACFDDFPKAKKYWDWRKMFDEMRGFDRCGRDCDFRPHARHRGCTCYDARQARVCAKASNPFGL